MNDDEEKKMMDSIDKMKVAYPMVARQLFACYTELRTAGFSEEQAFQMVLVWGISIPLRIINPPSL